VLFTDVSARRAVLAFQKAGFWLAGTFGRKHVGMTNGTRKIVIPRAVRINPYTLKGIIRAAGLTDKEFRRLL
jgi:predicted RNA binding protein YcfA (HicA-like mRNA interferase family)